MNPSYNPRTVKPGTKRNERYLENKLASVAVEHKDSVKKWERDNPGKQPGHSFKKNTYKAWSLQLMPTEHFRAQFDDICWCGETISPRCRRHNG